ncbi:polysaccharide pyruvyl transferase family protein [Psychroserpens sp. Hel_I_66]|uniref:polysaccharide pyruvyl transferase family protein n=1 Tax=Psychroserpens sp. Hel_I_66 TaxID=1250004 RepID=UPI000645B9B1|nr:polysaccharide pyruvyl transferase family protein [Psychroserpens sp. Hel_I_66]
MYIQVDNVGFINKGAELMLHSVSQRLNKDKNYKFHLVKGFNCYGPTEKFNRLGMFQIFEFQRFKIKLEKLFEQPRLERFGLVKLEHVDAILDASGFQFGDQWVDTYNKNYISKFKDYYSKYKKNHTKVILLPQAFGPFKEPLSREIIELVYAQADVLFARDKTSYKHLTTVFGQSDKIKMAPDFTILVKPEISLNLYNKVNNRVCIVVNSKMISHTNREVANAYTNFILKLSKELIKKDEQLTLLNHEGEQDLKLIKEIYDQIDNKDKVIILNDLDGLSIKAAIGKSKLLISSRFHGVVSGLNQRVPTFCTSWSHKYSELLADYGLENNLLDVNDLEDSYSKVLDGLANPDRYIAKTEILTSIEKQTETMWATVISTLK